jgi:hypothetical protein
MSLHVGGRWHEDEVQRREQVYAHARKSPFEGTRSCCRDCFVKLAKKHMHVGPLWDQLSSAIIFAFALPFTPCTCFTIGLLQL